MYHCEIKDNTSDETSGFIVLIENESTGDRFSANGATKRAAWTAAKVSIDGRNNEYIQRVADGSGIVVTA